jgi:hypothetical protein
MIVTVAWDGLSSNGREHLIDTVVDSFDNIAEDVFDYSVVSMRCLKKGTWLPDTREDIFC